MIFLQGGPKFEVTPLTAITGFFMPLQTWIKLCLNCRPYTYCFGDDKPAASACMCI